MKDCVNFSRVIQKQEEILICFSESSFAFECEIYTFFIHGGEIKCRMKTGWDESRVSNTPNRQICIAQLNQSIGLMKYELCYNICSDLKISLSFFFFFFIFLFWPLKDKHILTGVFSK